MTARIKDKDYVRTKHDLLFNVTGYRHPDSHVFGSLKYVSGEKWTSGYAAAKRFLAEHYPEYVGEYVQIPIAEIEQCFRPQHRWLELQQCAMNQTRALSSLHREALDLGEALQAILEIPASAMGITDSLLWGNGHAESDIDLVVVGLPSISRITRFGHLLYSESPDFQRPDPNVMCSPYGLNVSDWPALLERKVHMGAFRGRLFSVRGVLSDEELRLRAMEPWSTNGDCKRTTVDFSVVDVSESLLFPSVYRNDQGDELVDYSVVYEGAFRSGDVVRCECDIETTGHLDRTVRKYIMHAPASILR